jgi:integrase
MLRDDPTDGIPTPKLPKSDGHHSWSDAEIAQYRAHWPIGTQLLLVMEFAFETVSRRGEIVRLGPQHVHIDPDDGSRWIPIKRMHGSADVDIPRSPELAAAIDAMPKAHLTFLTTAYGKPRSKFGLGTDFAAWAREAGLPDHCRLHGLKKGGMRRGADAGMTAHELMAQSGHKSSRRSSATPREPTRRGSPRRAWRSASARARTAKLQTARPPLTNRAKTCGKNRSSTTSW